MPRPDLPRDALDAIRMGRAPRPIDNRAANDAPDPAAPGRLERLGNRMEALAAELQTLEQRLGQVTIRVTGELYGQGEAQDRARPERGGALGAIEDRLDDVNMIADRLANAVRTLEDEL